MARKMALTKITKSIPATNAGCSTNATILRRVLEVAGMHPKANLAKGSDLTFSKGTKDFVHFRAGRLNSRAMFDCDELGSLFSEILWLLEPIPCRSSGCDGGDSGAGREEGKAGATLPAPGDPGGVAEADESSMGGFAPWPPSYRGASCELLALAGRCFPIYILGFGVKCSEVVSCISN